MKNSTYPIGFIGSTFFPAVLGFIGAFVAPSAALAAEPAPPAPAAAPPAPAAAPSAPSEPLPAPSAEPLPAPSATDAPPAPASAPPPDTFAATDSAVAAPTPASPADAPNDLVPPGEKEKMGPHKVDAAGLEFKPGKGLTVKSADGDFELTSRIRAQFLYTLSRDHKAELTQDSFQVRRLRLTFEGSAFGKHNRFKVELGIGGQEDKLPTGGPAGNQSTSPLLDAYAEFDYLRDLTFRVGQYKTFGRQRLMSEGNLQLVDVSAVTTEFSFDRDVGLDFRSKDFLGLNALHYVLGLYTGQGKNSFAPTPTKFAMTYLARVEVLPFGNFEDAVEADFERTGPRLSVGATALHQTEGPRDRGSVGNVPVDGGSTDFNALSGDALFKVAGLSAITEIYYRHGNRNVGPDAAKIPAGGTLPNGVAPNRDGIGWYGQAGYLLPGMPLEIVARYGMIRGRTVAEHNGLKDTNELGGGLGYYIARHPLKVQADFFRGYESGKMSDGTDTFRVQLQIAL